MTHPALYQAASKLARFVPWPATLPQWGVPVLSEWQKSRDFPGPAKQSFRDVWDGGLRDEPADSSAAFSGTTPAEIEPSSPGSGSLSQSKVTVQPVSAVLVAMTRRSDDDDARGWPPSDTRGRCAVASGMCASR